MRAIGYKLAIEKCISLPELGAMIILALVVYCHDLLSVSFQADETYWIVTSTRLDQFIKGDFSEASWPEGFGTFEVRPIPSYFVAIGQRLAGISPSQLPTKYWDFSESPEANDAMGTMPSERVLYYSRLPMAIMSAFGIVLVAWLLATSLSRLTGYIFLAISLTSPYFLLHLRRAMSEACLFFFTVLAIAAIWNLISELRAGKIRGALLWSVVVGILTGLAGESKLIGLGCAIVALTTTFFTVFQYPLPELRNRLRQIEIIAMSVALTTSAVFISTYPFLYHKTLQHLAGTVAARIIVLNDQVAEYPAVVILPNQRAVVLLNRVFTSPFGLPGEGSHLPLPLFLLGLTIAGVYFAIRGSFAATRQADMFALLLIAGICLAGPMLFTPLDWDRYYLYPVFFAFIFLSICISKICLSLRPTPS